MDMSKWIDLNKLVRDWFGLRLRLVHKIRIVDQAGNGMTQNNLT